jgi:hypothetical protein
MPRAEQQTAIGGGGASTPLLAPEQQLDASVDRRPTAASSSSGLTRGAVVSEPPFGRLC